MPLRICAVSFADVRGIRHTVEVQAESLFEAAILGVCTFRGDPWIEHVGPATVLDIEVREPAAPHAVAKLDHIAWPDSTLVRYQAAVGSLRSTVDGVQRQAAPWPDWALTTVIDARPFCSTVWRAVSCHESQLALYERLKELSTEQHAAIWGSQSFYRAFSLVNGGRMRETDLLEGIDR